MDSYERCHKCFFKWLQQFLKIVGHNVLSQDFKIGPHALFIYFLYIPSIISIIYTLVAFDLFAKLNVIVYACLAIQVCIRKVIFMKENIEIINNCIFLVGRKNN